MMTSGRRTALIYAALIVGIMASGAVSEVSATSPKQIDVSGKSVSMRWSAAGSPTTTISLSDTTTTTVKSNITTTTVKSDTTATTIRNRDLRNPIQPCVVGRTGPGGGVVFYVANSPQPWGRCLEAAPNSWKGGTSDPVVPWGCPGTNITGAQGTAIGTGQANTTAIVGACTTAGIAARLADNLVFGGKSDWFLPSKAELGWMYSKRTIIGGFIGNFYWSSSQQSASNAWGQVFSGGSQGVRPRGQTAGVRPIRAIP